MDWIKLIKPDLAIFHRWSLVSLAKIRHKKYSPVIAGLGEEEYTTEQTRYYKLELSTGLNASFILWLTGLFLALNGHP